MKIGFTGTRDGCSLEQLEQLYCLIDELFKSDESISEAHHGDCLGADEQFAEIVRMVSPEIVIHSWPCNIPYMRANTSCDVLHDIKPPLVRNRDIVDSVDVMLACPSGEQEVIRSGTWATIRYARKSGKTPNIIYPSGVISFQTY